MSVLLLEFRLLIFAGCCSAMSTSSPLSTSPDVMDACDRLPWEECVLPTDLWLNTNLGEIKSPFKVLYVIKSPVRKTSLRKKSSV